MIQPIHRLKMLTTGYVTPKTIHSLYIEKYATGKLWYNEPCNEPSEQRQVFEAINNIGSRQVKLDTTNASVQRKNYVSLGTSKTFDVPKFACNTFRINVSDIHLPQSCPLYALLQIVRSSEACNKCEVHRIHRIHQYNRISTTVHGYLYIEHRRTSSPAECAVKWRRLQWMYNASDSSETSVQKSKNCVIGLSIDSS